MNICILTQPLLNNYGCLLQNYALQLTLKKLGAKPYTVDWMPPKSPLYLFFLSWCKTIMLRMIGVKRPFAKISKEQICRRDCFDEFVQKYIIKTENNTLITPSITKNADVVIVGSDQVWRPKYNHRSLANMFLAFCKKQKRIKRIAYAASFGVDEWEYTHKQTCECSKLAKKFNAISVREWSGVRFCKECLGVDATWVLDPTLLLKKEDYLPICKMVPVNNEKYLAVYVLDEREDVSSICECEAKNRGLVIKKFSAGSDAKLSVPEWLAMFRDASYIVTDSFHGTVFSIIFGKEFKCVYNDARGTARFESLLKLYDSGKLGEMRDFSLNWLKNALES